MLSFISLAMGDGTITEEHLDPVGSCQSNKTKVVKKADVKYKYVLYAADKWTQFPDFNMEVYLEFDQFVRIKYKIVLYQGSHLYTRVIIDGV